MVFAKRIERAFTRLSEKARESEQVSPSVEREALPLEKGDYAAMALSALWVLVPLALLALLVICGVAFALFS